MKLLLINTPINRHDMLGDFSSIYDDMKMIPTGIAYLASFVRKAGIDVKILDQYAECLSMDRIYDLIKKFSPDLIGYSSTTPNYYAAIHMARQIRNNFPNILTVMGGIHPSIFPKEVLDDDAIDFVIRDEGEFSLLELCKELENNSRNFERIDGLSFKDPQGQIHNGRAQNVNLDKLPFPAYDLLPMHLYSSPSYTKYASPVYQMIASRGCPFSCTYCINAELNISAKYRRRDLNSVVDEIELLVNKYKARQIQFWDPIFPLGRQQALDFCKKIIDKDLHKKIVWTSTTRAEFITEEIVKAMVKSGCKAVGFGIESGVPELLHKVNKKLDLEKVRHTCRICKKHGLVVFAAFILGFPDETKEMTQQTIDFAKSLDIYYAQFSIMVPYPGTPLHRELEQKGEIRSTEEKDFVRYNQSIGLTDVDLIYVPKGRDASELKKMQKQAYRQFYLRPRMLLMHLPHLRFSKIIGMIRSLMAILNLVATNTKEKRTGRKIDSSRTLRK